MTYRRAGLAGESSGRRNLFVALFALVLVLVAILPAHAYAAAVGSAPSAGDVGTQVDAPAVLLDQQPDPNAAADGSTALVDTSAGAPATADAPGPAADGPAASDPTAAADSTA